MSSVKKDLFTGVFWSAVEKYSGLVVSTIVSMVLARLLMPEEFGTIAIAMVIISFIALLCNMGIGPAIIQRKDLDHHELDTIFTFSCLVGTCFALIMIGISWPVSKYYGIDTLRPICQILSINVFFSAANMVPNALMARNKRFKQIAQRTLILQIVSGIIAIIFALKGFGVYSLLVSPLLTSTGIFIYNRRYYRVSLTVKFSLTPIKKIFSYSSYQFLFQFVNYWAVNIDKLLTGKLLSISQLGYYQKSYQLIQLPLNNVSSVINPVLQPTLSDLQNDKISLFEKYAKIVRFIAIIACPLSAMLVFCGKEIIQIFYGPNWDNSIPSFQILAFSLPFKMVLASTGSFFQSSNETKRLFIVGLIGAIATISAVVVGSLLGRTIEYVALGLTIASVINFMVTYFFIHIILKNISFGSILSIFTGPYLSGIITFLLLLVVNSVLKDYYYINFIIKILLSGCVILTSAIRNDYLSIELIKRKLSERIKWKQ